MSVRFECPCCGTALKFEVSLAKGLKNDQISKEEREANRIERRRIAAERKEARHWAIAEAYQSGLSAAESAAQFGLSPSHVYQVLKRLGIERRHHRGRAKPTERELEMIELYASGKTLEEIGHQFGITRERVRQILVKRGEGTQGAAEARRVRQRTRQEILAPRIIERFQTEGISSSGLARSMGIEAKCVMRVLKQAGVYEYRAPKKIGLRRSLANDPEMIRLYEETDTSVAELTTMFGFKNELSCRTRLCQLGGRRRKPKVAA